MGLIRPGSGAESAQENRAQRLDVVLGILGFFGLMALVQTVVLELGGKPAAASALLLLGLLVAFWLVLRARRRLFKG
jgi:hypothetical protein